MLDTLSNIDEVLRGADKLKSWLSHMEVEQETLTISCLDLFPFFYFRIFSEVELKLYTSSMEWNLLYHLPYLLLILSFGVVLHFFMSIVGVESSSTRTKYQFVLVDLLLYFIL